MPRLKKITITPVDVDADGIAESQTPSGAGNLSLDGALGTTLTYASQLSITSAGNDSARTFTITGTDQDGRSISEDVTGPNATTVESSKYFKTISSIAIDDAAAGAITVGTVDEVVSPTYPYDRFHNPDDTLQTTVSGTINYTVEVTATDIQNTDSDDDINWIDHDVLTSKTASDLSNIGKSIRALRVKVNSYSSGASVILEICQNSRH